MTSSNRPYQDEALAAIASSPHRRSLLCLATGLGKTRVAAQLPRALGARRVLVLAHRFELIEQLSSAFVEAGNAIGIERAEQRARGDEHVIVASTATLSASPERLERLLERAPFDLVIRDEAHHALAASEMRLWTRLGFLDDEGAKTASPRARLIGLTATPGRGDGETLRKLFDGIDYEMGIEAGTRAGWLVPIRAFVITTTTVIDTVKRTAGDFSTSALSRAVNVDPRNASVVDGWRKHAQGLRSLVFGVDVAHAERLAECFRDAGADARCVHGGLAADERAALLSWFQTTPGAVLTNCALIDEGTDLPGIEAVIMAAPTASATRYAQRIGRGVRPAPGKDDVVVIDLVDPTSIARRAFDIRQLFNMPQPDKLLAGENVLEERDAQVAAVLAGAIEASKVTTTSRRVDLFAVGEQTRARLPGAELRWVPLGDGFALSLRRERATLVITEDELGGVTLERTGEGALPVRRFSGDRATFHAVAAAEAHARRVLGADVVVLEVNASWGREAPSPKQLELCRRKGIRVPARATRGDVSSAISAALGTNAKPRTMPGL